MGYSHCIGTNDYTQVESPVVPFNLSLKIGSICLDPISKHTLAFAPLAPSFSHLMGDSLGDVFMTSTGCRQRLSGTDSDPEPWLWLQSSPPSPIIMCSLCTCKALQTPAHASHSSMTPPKRFHESSSVPGKYGRRHSSL